MGFHPTIKSWVFPPEKTYKIMFTDDNYEASVWMVMTENNMTWREAEEYLTELADAWD